MKRITTFLVVTVFLPCSAGLQTGRLAYGSVFEGRGDFLVWEKAAAVGQGGRHYVYRPGEELIVELPGGMQMTGRVDAGLSRWSRNSWQSIGNVSGKVTEGAVRISRGIKEEGFFRLRIGDEGGVGNGGDFVTYVIISSNWKRDLLAFCRREKDEIESNADAKLISSSFAVSHFDHTMEKVSEAELLSGEIVAALSDAVVGKRVFEGGECPEPVRGLNKIRLKRFAGADIGEFVVFVPADYDGSRKWPVLLSADPRRREARGNYRGRSGFIDIWWHFPGYQSFEWKDYEYFMDVLNDKLNIDEDRIYLFGICANGIGAMALGLNHPDEWAECVSILGSSYRHLACNALNLPVIFVQGGHSQGFRISSYNFAVQSFLYAECENFKHSDGREGEEGLINELRGSAEPNAVRVKHPERVRYRIDSAGNPRAYWVEIIGRENENFAGTMDALVEGQKIIVKTSNINGYVLDLVQAPLDSNKAVEIIEDGESVWFSSGRYFRRDPVGYESAAYVKKRGLGGPVGDVFREPYVVVCGNSGDDRSIRETSAKIGESLSKGAPCYRDSEVPSELAESHNMVLVGTPESNLWLSKICVGLPVEIGEKQIIADGKAYGGDVGVIAIHPNPVNPHRYVLVLSGCSAEAIEMLGAAYLELSSMRSADVGVFEITGGHDVKWHIVEKLSTTWGWQAEWNVVLAVLEKRHSRWRWGQWCARAVREQLEVDVAIYENPLRVSGMVPEGEVTYRSLFNIFRNDWVLKIRLDGRGLRGLLASWPGDISKGELGRRCVEGLSFVKVDSGGEVLVMDEIEDGRNYTVGLSEKAASKIPGMIEYELVGECYLVPLLKRQLEARKEGTIDDELEILKLNIL